MINNFRAVNPIERFAVKLMKQTLKRMLEHFGRHDRVVTNFSRALNESKFALKKLMIVDLIDS